MSPPPPRWQTVALVAAAVVVGLALRLVTFTGLIASDDLTHVWAATHVWDDPVEHASNLERHPAPPSPPPGRVIYQGQTRGGRDWLVVYAIGLEPPAR